MTPEFTFEKAEQICEYLRDLGISDFYASPVFTARKGSEHGYDIVNMNEINPELGGRDGFERLSSRLRELNMNWLQDIVPNHRAFEGSNKLLMDIFEKGPESPFFHYFDITWDHTYESINGRVLAPFLGDFYARCLERGELRLDFSEDGFRIYYYEKFFPISLASYRMILVHNLNRLIAEIGHRHPDLVKFNAIINFLDNLDMERENNPDFDYAGFVKKILRDLYEQSEWIHRHIDDNVKKFNGAPGDPDSFNLLDELLDQQYFRLSYWKVGTQELNYRRFFSINDLISLRVENEEVFLHTHKLLFELINEGKINGVRLDHIDGLFDPTNYLNRLREKAPEVYMVAEKILEPEEDLPVYWPLHGTTGYDFLAHVNGVFIDAGNEDAFTRIYHEFSGRTRSFDKIITDKKRSIIGKHMAGDIDNLALKLKDIANRSRRGNDLTLYGLRRAMVEILTQFPIYRTYVDQDHFSERDRNVFELVIKQCKEIIPDLVNEFELIHSYILGEFEGETDEEEREDWRYFIMRLQQYTGPLMAKGVEDTAFYIYNRFCSLNEVGNDPRLFGCTVEKFHDFNMKRSLHWPRTMNATSSHDTKRGEDVRTRVNVISENPDEWERNIKSWRNINHHLKTWIRNRECPTANDEYFIYQTLIGAMPFEGPEADNFTERMKEYFIKTAREAKLNTSWLRPDGDYEDALIRFVQNLLKTENENEFLQAFLPYQKKTAFFGILNSLTQTTLKLCCPGIPDLYQGTELWDINLVDPDNRRPVDYEKRKEYIRDILHRFENDTENLLKELTDRPETGKIKMFLINRLLETRRKHPSLFLEGDYQPLSISGAKRWHLIAFSRQLNNKVLIVITTRFHSRIYSENTLPIPTEIWEDAAAHVPERQGDYLNVLTGEKISVDENLLLKDVLDPFPVCALLKI